MSIPYFFRYMMYAISLPFPQNVMPTLTLISIVYWSLTLFRADKSERVEVPSKDRAGERDLDEPNKLGLTPLHAAVRVGRAKSARKLVELGASVDRPTTHQRNAPLHYAARAGNCCSETPWLDVSCAFGHVTIDKSREFAELAELFLSKGADPNLKNHRGNGPLHAAIAAPSCRTAALWGARIVRLLVDWGAHVDLRNDDGETPLSMAIRCRSDACVRELLRCGANVRDEAVARRIGKLENATAAVKEHWVKLYSAGLPCFGEWNVDEAVESREWLYHGCFVEVDAMKNTFVDVHTSLYDFLRMDDGWKRAYAKEDKLKRLVESPTLEREFPNYHVLIEGSYREAVARRSLLKRAAEAWHATTKIHLPEVCVERILDFLTNGDMLAMIENRENEATKPNDDESNCSWAARLHTQIRRFME